MVHESINKLEAAVPAPVADVAVLEHTNDEKFKEVEESVDAI
jgi:hypothetical protein